MIKAVFIDYMGTLVSEESRYLSEVIKRCLLGGGAKSPEEVVGFFQREHDRLLAEHYGGKFKSEYEICTAVFAAVKEQLAIAEEPAVLCGLMEKHWTLAPAFEDTRRFFESCPVPVYLVTNNDTKYLEAGMEHIGIRAARMITSETAKAYKPRKEIFQKALEISGCRPDKVVHVGDSVSNDVIGAAGAGIEPWLLDREGTKTADGVICFASLDEVLQEIRLRNEEILPD